MARNKFKPNIIGFDALVDCDCESIIPLTFEANKISRTKRVADNCFCQINQQDTPPEDRKLTKVSRIFIRLIFPNN